MRAILTTSAALMALAYPACASEGMYKTAACSAEFNGGTGGWLRGANVCHVVIDPKTRNTFIKMGDLVVLIERDPGAEGAATLTTMFRDGSTGTPSTVRAKGACWIGTEVKLCAL